MDNINYPISFNSATPIGFSNDMVSRAIRNAGIHNICVTPGRRTSTDGNCCFEAVIYNINDRTSFNERLNQSINAYREIWIDELQKEVEINHKDLIPSDYLPSQIESIWTNLKCPGNWNVDYGDLIIYAISRGCKKNIIVFNTSTEALSPIYVIQPQTYGGIPDTQIPVLLAYNESHYEHLIPKCIEDEDKTIALVTQYISNNYKYNKKDIPMFISMKPSIDLNKPKPLEYQHQLNRYDHIEFRKSVAMKRKIKQDVQMEINDITTDNYNHLQIKKKTTTEEQNDKDVHIKDIQYKTIKPINKKETRTKEHRQLSKHLLYIYTEPNKEQEKQNKDQKDRIQHFLKTVQYGPIFPCSSCEQMMFRDGVTVVTNIICDLIKTCFNNIILFETIFENKLTNPIFSVCIDSKLNWYLCHTCKKYLTQGRIPPMSSANGLKLSPVPKHLHLPELANTLIAKKILFQKIFRLPKSLWPGMKDRLINVPIEEEQVMHTLNTLPRTPSEAGITLIDVKLKRKLTYKNYVHYTSINPEQLFQAIEFLRDCGNPHYQFYQDPLAYQKRCQKEDLTGSQLLYQNDNAIIKETINIHSDNINNTMTDLKSEEPNIDDINHTTEQYEEYELQDDELQDNDEKDYQQNDPIRKFQIDYDQSVCTTPRFPEALYDEKKTRHSHVISFAPGEGRTPENILHSKDWDAMAFPMKHPDGKYNLHYPRSTKLNDQSYFIQRLKNMDSRFRDDPSYLFAAVAFIEKKQLQKNINISFKRGKKSTSELGETTYKLEDAFSVFDNTSNTPAYHKKGKYEMMAKLDNLGAFQLFFTTSCADMRWEENITTILREKGLKIEYRLQSTIGSNDEGEEEEVTYVHFNGDQSCLPLHDYLQTQEAKSVHQILRNNVVTATRNYKHRLQTLIRKIILHPNNPMSVKYYSTKLEFQGRGAPHNHGVLWLDIDKLEIKIHKGNDICDIDSLFPKKEAPNMKRKIIDILHTVIVNKICISKEQTQSLSHIFDKLNIFNLTSENLLNTFKFFGIKSAFKKFQTLKDLDEHETSAIINFANSFTSVTISPALVGKKVSNIVKDVNCHRHTKACRRHNTACRFSFPKFPVWTTLLASPCKLLGDAFEKDAPNRKKRKNLLEKVKDILLDEKTISQILIKFPTINEYDKNEYEINRKKRIQEILKLVGLNKTNFHTYLDALKITTAGYSIIQARDIDEIFVNSYNPEWAEAWNGNTDLQVTLDYYSVITYISEYYTKDDTGTMKVLIDALKQTNSNNLKDKMITLMNTFISHRQMGEAEAVYKIFPDYHFRDSNLSTIFIPTNRRNDRHKFLIRVDDDPQYIDITTVNIPGREGKYIEKYDIVSKYERRPMDIENICLAQFAKMYMPAWKHSGKETQQYLQDVNTTDEIPKDEIPKEILHFHITYEGISHIQLPSILKLIQTHPDEPPYMRKRINPAIMRIHKFNKNNETNSYWFSELLLYKPYRNENEIDKLLEEINTISEDEDKQMKYTKMLEEISMVKKHVMEHLQSAEEARLTVEESIRNKDIEYILNPNGIQEIIDCNMKGPEPHPDYIHLDPDNVHLNEQINQFERTFLPIQVEEDKILWKQTRQLDFYQRKVLHIGIQYARDLIKALNEKNPLPEAPLLMVNGGAGSGKSTLINILKQWLHLILHKAGDNPEYPYVLVTAPTGTAASKVKGQTLHTTFGFNFGNEHYPLGDKKRDTTRIQFKNLSAIIVDEISMVKSDMLYMLDLRLREITLQNKIFGGLAMFFFGDIMQLKPCQAKYIFDEPQNTNFKLSFNIKPHWHTFEIITLETNHRQEEDRSYADILNRLRIEQHTEDDLTALRSRIRPQNHTDTVGATYISCTNEKVMIHNDFRLDELNTELVEIEAINFHPTITNFQPIINKKRRTVGNTSFLQTLKIKKDARVMLIHNLDTADGLTNGSRGTIIEIIKDQKQMVTILMVKMDDINQGARKRRTKPALHSKYPECTPIEKIQFQYSLSNKQIHTSNTATVYQFPLILCYAATCHKFQGQEIPKPQIAAVDLTSIFQSAMGYVMLSRVPSLKQLYIIDSLPKENLYADKRALEELRRMEKNSINNNPTKWETTNEWSIKIASLNINSLLPKLCEIREDPILNYADLLCFSETWLKHNNLDTDLNINELKLHLNSKGRGKGLATYYKDQRFKHKTDVNDDTMQITIMVSEELDVIGVYRSKTNNTLINKLIPLINPLKSTLICGDFNICSADKPNNNISRAIKNIGFTEIVQKPTHFNGGHIDHAYFLNKNDSNAQCCLYSSYYTAKDHDTLLITITKNTKEL